MIHIFAFLVINYGQPDNQILSSLPGHGFSADEPNDVLGDETCVRMRGGMYNDALCDDSNGFNKREQQVSHIYNSYLYKSLFYK